ncbi:MAG: heparinase II/III family protein [Acidobacteriota bacterium]|nr:heparinase II/III family protein [Acidobacteriota bacterium]
MKGRSLDELRVRSAQALAAYMERRGWSAQARLSPDGAMFEMLDATSIKGASVSAESLLEHFRARPSTRFFAAFANQQATIAELRRRFGPGAEEKVVERANRIEKGRFDLLGLRDLYFGEPVDWHLEPISGKRAPGLHWSLIAELDSEATGDKKIVWELNRHQHFMTLGRAYWYTRDERYAKTFIKHLNSWMDQNRPKIGINWFSSLEVAFRAISWLWGFYFFKNSPQLTPAVYLRALKFLYVHARHLETYLSTYYSPNTHLTGEALGLFYLGTMLPEFPSAAHWRATGRSILLRELDRQIKPDGVYFEQSSYYHRYTVDFYTHLYILSRANGEHVEEVLKQKLTALLDHLMYISRPDGTTPLYGDDDGGRLVVLDEREPNDFRAALSTGAILFDRSDYKYVAGEAAEETLWLLGGESLNDFDSLDAHPPQHTSRAFSDGGYFVMRDGWTRADSYLLIDCGPHGTLNGAHGHADALSFELAVQGRSLLVDPGTHTYADSIETRNYFRGSAAHNTLTIDGASSSIPDGPFSWKHVALARPRAWMSHTRFDFFEGEHDGYMRLPRPAMHVRSALSLKGDYWVMRDSVTTSGEHRYDLHFHFSPEVNPLIEAGENATFVREGKVGAGLEIFTFNESGEWRMEDGWVSRWYGERSVAPVCIFAKTAEGGQEFFTFLMPRQRDIGSRIMEIEAIGGRAFEVANENSLDVVMIRSGHFVETARLASDFEWVWARFSKQDQQVPDELVLIGGRTIHLYGKRILKSEKGISFLVASRIDDQFRLETSDGSLDLIFPVRDLESLFSKLQTDI